MPLTNSQYDRIMRIYNQRQLKSRRTLDARKDEVYAKIPRLAEIDADAASVSVRKALFQLGDKQDGRDIDLKDALNSLSEERTALLRSSGYPADYLDPVYECPLCHDTGYVNGQKCRCFRQLEIQLFCQDSGLDLSSDEESFDHFSLGYYSEEAGTGLRGLSARDEAEKALQTAEAFVSGFSDHFNNIFLYGSIGTGKTFLSRCIARELAASDHSVLDLTAYNLFDTLGKYRFSSDSELSEIHDAVFSSDLLIIDDLGAEMVNNFVSSELFLIVNERLIRRKPVIITTNLSLEGFKTSFSERTFSRIMGSYTLLHLSGKDIRIQKKLSASGGN